MAFTNWAAGMKITAARLRGITPKFENWTPTWTTSTGTNLPSYGNASINCRYAQSGDLVVATVEITFGNTTNFGGGGTGDNYRFGLPVPAARIGMPVGWISLFPGSAPAITTLVRSATSTEFDLWNSSGWAYTGATYTQNNGVMDAVSPWPWANANPASMFGTLTYEAA